MKTHKLSNVTVILVILATLLMIALTACRTDLDTPGEAAISPTQTTTPQPTDSPTPTPAILPLALVSAEPASGSTIGLTPQFSFEFNQAVDRESFEKHFTISPLSSGIFIWQDDLSVSYQVDEPLQTGAHYTITIGPEVTALNGSTMATATEWNFQTAEYLLMTQHYPQDGSNNISTNTAIWVAFNQPIVGEDLASEPAAFTLEPSVPGAGRWANHSTYIFYPSAPLISAADYTINIDPALSSLYSTSFADSPQLLTFKTEHPEVTAISPQDLSTLYPGDEVVITFNHEMDQDSVVSNIRVEDKNSNAIEPAFSWNESKTAVIINFSEVYQRDDILNITLNPAAKTRAGVPLIESVRLSYNTLNTFKVETTPPTNLPVASSGYTELTFTFNNPVDPEQELIGLVDIRPRLPGAFTASLDETGTRLTYGGFFQPATYYSYSVSPDLVDQWGQPLGTMLFKRFLTGRAPAAILLKKELTDTPLIFIPLNDINLPVETTNVRNVDIRSLSMSIEEFIGLYCDTPDCLQWYNPEFDRSWVQVMSPYLINAALPSELILAPRNQKLESGLFLFEVTSTSLSDDAGHKFLAVAANTHLTLQRNGNELLIWAVDMETLAPVENAPVSLYDDRGAIIDGGSTDARGLLTLPVGDQPLMHAAMYQPGHPQFGFASIDQTNILTNPSSKFEADFFLNRPVYTPGEWVNFSVILTPYFTQTLPPTIKVALEYEFNQVQSAVQEITLASSGTGMFAGSILLPDSLPLGGYQLSITDSDIFLPLTVVENATTDNQLFAAFDQPHWQYSDTVTAQIAFHYAFGAPITNQPVNWQLMAEEVSDADGSLLLQSGECLTDEQGACSLSISPDQMESLDLTREYLITLHAQAIDPVSAQAISAHTFANLHPADFSIDIKLEKWLGSAGESIGIEVNTYTFDRLPYEGIALSANLEKVGYTENITYNRGTERIQRRPVYTQIASTSFITDQDGYARLAFTPPDPGVYRINVTDQRYTEDHYFFVDGETADQTQWLEPAINLIELVSDKTLYGINETAQIYIPNPFLTKAIALISVQTADEQRELMLELDQPGEIVDINIKANDYPQVQLSVTIIGDDRDGVVSHRIGQLVLSVERQTRSLSLEADFNLNSTEETATLNLAVTANEGNPVKANYSFLLLPSDWAEQTGVDQVWFQQNFSGFPSASFAHQLDQYIRSLPWSSDHLFSPTMNQSPFASPPDTPMGVSPLPAEQAIYLTNLSTDENGTAFIAFPLESGHSDYQAYLIARSDDLAIGYAHLYIAGQIQESLQNSSISESRRQPFVSGLLSSPSQQNIILPMPASQTSSEWQITLLPSEAQVFSYLAARDIPRLNHPEGLASQILGLSTTSDVRAINQLLDNLVGLQRPEGGWSFSEHNQTSDPDLTAYVTLALVESRQVDELPTSAKTSLLTYIESQTFTDRNRQILQRYLIQNLRLQQQDFSMFLQEVNSLSIVGQSFLLMAFTQQGDTGQQQQALIEQIQNQSLYDQTGIFFAPDSAFPLFNSIDTTLALVTSAVQKSQLTSALAGEMIHSLIQRRLFHQTDLNSIADALTMTVLAQYLSTNSIGSTYDLSITTNTEVVFEENAATIVEQAGQALHTEIDNLTPWLSLSRGEGDGNLYFVLTPMADGHASPTTGVNVEHAIYDTFDNCRPGFCTPIHSMEEADLSGSFVGRITLTAQADQQYLLVTLPLPPEWNIEGVFSGSHPIHIVPENPLALGTSPGTFEAMIDEWHQTIYWFAPRLSAGTYELLYYFTMGDTSASATVPPVTVYSPYQGQILASTSHGGTIQK